MKGTIQERRDQVVAFSEKTYVDEALRAIATERNWKDAYVHCIFSADEFLKGVTKKIVEKACFVLSRSKHREVSHDYLRKRARVALRTFSGEPIRCYYTIHVIVSADNDLCLLGGLIPNIEKLLIMQRRRESSLGTMERLLKEADLSPERRAKTEGFARALASYPNHEVPIYNQKNVRTCSHCKLRAASVNLAKCSACKLVYYCSKECQVADWKNHKKICNK